MPTARSATSSSKPLSQWDARWFLQISLHGYEEVPQAAAFFPVYPAVVHALTWVTGSELVAGVLISLVAGGVAAWVLAQLARPLLGERGAHDVVLYFALYPVGFVFTSLYSEGLFIALAAGSFLAATRGRPLLAGVLGGLATGTRLMGLALLPALVLLLWRGRDPRSLARLAPLLLLPAAVGLYALYLDWAIGDAVGVHERPGRLEPQRLAARAARGAQGRRPVRGPRPAPPVRHARRRAWERAARRPLEPLPPGAARRRRSG